MRHQVDDTFGAFLDVASHLHQTRGHDGKPEPFERTGPHDDVCDACFIFESDEDGLAIARPLANKDNACDVCSQTMSRLLDFATAQNALCFKHRAQKLHRVRLERQPHRLVISSDMFAQMHHRQVRIGFHTQFARARSSKKGQLTCRGSPRFPGSLASIKPQ